MIASRAFVIGRTSLIVLANSNSVYAQERPAEPPTELRAEDVIIVEARRRDENLQDVPLVVNAVTSDQIDKLNIRDFRDITGVVPGLSLTSNANGIGSSSSMRGVNHDVNVSGNNGTIQYYYNDAPVASNLVLQAMYDIGQIEVLRGPQGTLRGKATPSGSITVGLRKPDLSQPGANVSVSAGSASARNLQAAINVPIIADKLGVRIAGLYDYNRGNRVYSINSDSDPMRKTRSIRASARAEPTDFLKFGFVYQALQVNALQFDQMESTDLFNPSSVPSSNANDYGTLTLKDRASVMAYPRDLAQNFKFYGWDAEADLLGQSLIYVGARQTTTFHALTPQDTTNFFSSLAPTQQTTTRGEGTTHEIRLQNQERIAGIFDYVVGYFHSDGSSNTVNISPSVLRFYGKIPPSTTFPLPVPPRVNDTPIYLPPGGGETESSFFGNVTVHLGEGTELAGGLRRIKYVNDSTGVYISCTPEKYAAGTCVQTPGTENDSRVHKTIYNATVRHRFNDSLMVYAATGSSWRPPVRAIGDFSVSYSPNEIEHTAFGSETSKSYELGFKSDWLDHSLAFNVTGYHQKFKNYPFRAGTGIYYVNVDSTGALTRGQFNFISAVPVTVNGVEAELSYRPSNRFNLASTLNYSKSKIGNAMVACTDALNNATGAVGSDGIPDSVVPSLAQLQAAYGTEHLAECPSSGGSATFLPPWSGSIQAEYTMPLTGRADGYLRGLLAWRGKSQNDPDNPFDNVGAYGLLNLFVGLRDPGGAWELSFYGKNLTNITKLLSRDSSPLSTGTVDILLGAPTFTTPVGTASSTFTSRYTNVTTTPAREFGVNFRVAFGSR
ncbi:TonB-dependent receptor [uncultured Novosphingobium sp.]|uniref:TonB-dependent receptor n=1 Tax=uncultured Novosphingobium sp. TaxID=292277 RepID=UPI00259A007C|nr:TonB-dependent receptor [uncultured Novosphingobium sp.]